MEIPQAGRPAGARLARRTRVRSGGGMSGAPPAGCGAVRTADCGLRTADYQSAHGTGGAAVLLLQRSSARGCGARALFAARVVSRGELVASRRISLGSPARRSLDSSRGIEGITMRCVTWACGRRTTTTMRTSRRVFQPARPSRPRAVLADPTRSSSSSVGCTSTTSSCARAAAARWGSWCRVRYARWARSGARSVSTTGGRYRGTPAPLPREDRQTRWQQRE